MDIDISKASLKDLEKFDEDHQDWIFNKIEELANNPTNHESSGLVLISGAQVFKYVMKKGSKGGKDYRAIYNIENSKIKIKAIFHRDQGYDKQKLSERI